MVVLDRVQHKSVDEILDTITASCGDLALAAETLDMEQDALIPVITANVDKLGDKLRALLLVHNFQALLTIQRSMVMDLDEASPGDKLKSYGSILSAFSSLSQPRDTQTQVQTRNVDDARRSIITRLARARVQPRDDTGSHTAATG